MNNNIQICRFKDYTINPKYVSIIFKSLFNIIHLSEKYNLDFCILGGISLILRSGKMYRTPSDLDILVDIEYLKKWQEILSDDEWYFDEKNLKKINDLLENYNLFLNKTKLPNIRAYHKHSNLFMDLYIGNNLDDFEKIKVFDKVLKFESISKALYNKQGLEKDVDDYEFYQFLFSK